MQAIENAVSWLNGIVWGPPMLILLGVTGVFLTVGLGFMPIRRIPYAFGLLANREKRGEGEISSFQALMTALAATVGTGNIAGVATAIFLGGPGAVFYMWLIALIGMATKYAEAVCAVTYREVDHRGMHVGGPMYYIKNGIGPRLPWLAAILAPLFALFAAVAAFGIGNGVQANSVADAMEASFGVPKLVSGLTMAALVKALRSAAVLDAQVALGRRRPDPKLGALHAVVHRQQSFQRHQPLQPPPSKPPPLPRS